MKPVMTVEFKAKAAGVDLTEETVALHNTAELFEFVAPGGGCEKIPDEVDEIQMVFMPVTHRNQLNPVANYPATLQLGMVLFTGPLAEIAQTAEQILDKAGRGELSSAFVKVIAP